MTFSDAIGMLTDGRAAKRTSWAGYCWREDDADKSDGSYSILFLKRATATSETVTYDYKYYYDGTSETWTSDASATMDAELFASMIANDWTVGKATDFETARKGGEGIIW